MLEIKFDPSTLTKAQREDLASFILGFEETEKPSRMPQLDESAPCKAESIEKLSLSSVYGEFKSARPIGEDPNEVFGAPSSADVDQSLTAQEVTKASTSTQPLTAPPPPVPNYVTPGTIAAPQSQNLAEVDSKGRKWDARIHSSSKAKIADGTWKYRRGVTDEEIKRVEGELAITYIDRGSISVISSGSAGNLGTAGMAARPEVSAGGGAGPFNLGNIQPPGMGGVVDPVTLRQQFAQLMLKVAKSKGEGKLTAEEVTAALQPYGVASLPLLANKLEVVPEVTAAIDAILASKG